MRESGADSEAAGQDVWQTRFINLSLCTLQPSHSEQEKTFVELANISELLRDSSRSRAAPAVSECH